MKKLLLSLVIFCGIIFLYSENTFSQVVVKVKPAKPKVVVVKPPKPGPRHVWVDGHWRWNKKMKEYVWVKGHWVRPKRGHAWVPGHWKKVPDGFKWVPGHWRR